MYFKSSDTQANWLEGGEVYEGSQKNAEIIT